MRKVNAMMTVLIMVLFMVHMIRGILVLAGMVSGGGTFYTALTHTLLTLIAVHAAISVFLTAKTLFLSRRAGASYAKPNRLFWIRRISGLALMLFLICHIQIFRGTTASGAYRLNLFGATQLATQLLLAASLLVHLIGNISPLRIALGLEDRHGLRTDLLLVLSVLLFLAGAAFVVYFIRWSVY